MGTSRQSIKGQKRIQTRMTRRIGKQELSLHVTDAIEERTEEALERHNRMVMLHGINPITREVYTFVEYIKVISELDPELTSEESRIANNTCEDITYYHSLDDDLALTEAEAGWPQNLYEPALV